MFSQDGYLISKDERFLFVLVEDRPTGGGFLKHAAPLETLRAHIQQLRHTFPDVQAGVTGGKALASDEMLASQRDNTLASVIAFAGVAALFMLGFREMRSPLLVVATLMYSPVLDPGVDGPDRRAPQYPLDFLRPYPHRSGGQFRRTTGGPLRGGTASRQ